MNTPDAQAIAEMPPHLLLRASAGSGKTYRLTQRYLGLLRLGVPADTVLATTFTRKAAGEILGRLMLELVEQAEHDPANRMVLESMCRRLHRLSVSTIDGFFFRLASGFRLELDLPARPTVVADGHPAAVELRRRAIEAVLDDAADSEASFTALLGLLRRLYHDEPGRTVTEALRRIVDDHAGVFEQVPDPAAWTHGPMPGGLERDELNAAVDVLALAEPMLPTTTSGKPDGRWLKAWRKDLENAHAHDWDRLIEKNLGGVVARGGGEFYKREMPAELAEVYRPLVDHAVASYHDRIARQTEATFELMARFTSAYDRRRGDAGLLLHRDVVRRLAGLRWRDGDGGDLFREVYFRLDAQVRHLLLDEFQDTSLDQWRVLFPLADEMTADATADRSLFVVGDPKQAIYGWRGGCVELFDAAATLRGVETTPMARSYRSSQVVLDVVNQVFSDLGVCPSLGDDREAGAAWSSRFDPHKAAIEKPGFVSFEASPLADKDGGEDAAEVHRRHVADRIEAIHRAAPGASIGVLMRANKPIAPLLIELRQRGLPAGGEGGNLIADHPAVAAVLSALVMADHPGDGPSAFHVANSPMGEVLGMDRQTQAREVAQRVRAALLRDGFAATVAGWTRELAGSCDALGLDRLTQLVELAEGYDAVGSSEGGPLRPARFVDVVEATAVEEAGGASIRLMTVHKSKGLQFDAVVLPDLDGRMKFDEAVLVDRPDALSPIERVWRMPSGPMRERVPEWDAAYRRERDRRRAEDFSTLYVAMTRPRHGLYLIVQPSATPRLNKLRPAAVLRDRLGDPDDEAIVSGDPGWTSAFAEAPGAATGEPVLVDVRLEHGHAPRRMRPRVVPSSLHDGGRADAAGLLSLTRDPAAVRGEAIHAALERVGYLDDPGAEVIVGGLGLDSELSHAAVRAALSRRFGDREELWRERAFVVADGPRVLRGVFDRVAIERDDSGQATAAHLIDFKSDRLPGAGSEVLAERVEAYRPQVAAYRRALAKMLTLPPKRVTAELVFTSKGVSVEL
ncbi:MAG: UvrD-helicase domain-containing protein [Planctomycetota bacterium]